MQGNSTSSQDLGQQHNICQVNRPTSEWISFMVVTANSATLSAVGSSLIIFMILRGGRVSLTKVRNRLLLPMSIIDVIQSIAMGLSTLPIPRGSLCTYGAIGNATTCAIQGFAVHIGLSVPSYNAMLCLYYMLTIKSNMTKEKIQKYEPFMHAFALIPSFSTSIAAASLSLLNNMSMMCMIGEKDRYLPKDIGGTSTNGEEKKKSLSTLILAYYGVAMFLFLVNFVIICVTTISLCISVREKEKQMDSLDFRLSLTDANGRKMFQRENNKNSLRLGEDTKRQAYLYVASFLITFIIPIISGIIGIFMDASHPSAIRLLYGVLFPLQGFWNFLAFIRPKYNLVAIEQNDKTFIQKIYITIFVPSTGTSDVRQRRSSRIVQLQQPGANNLNV